MRTLPLLACALWACATVPAWAQALPLRAADTTDAAALARALPPLAQALLAQRPPAQTEAERVTQMRLQLVAGQAQAALDTLEALRQQQALPGQPDAAPAFVQYELHARALLVAGSADAPAYGPALEQAFRERFAAFNPRQAYRATLGLAYDLPQAWQAVQGSVARLKFDGETVAAPQALELLNSYQPWQAYSAMLPRLPALIEADEQARYERQQVRVPAPGGVPLSAFVVRPRGVAGPLPAAMVFTIYAEAERPWREAVQAAAYGYAGVVAFSRGKVESPGPIVPYEHEAQDVNTVIGWVSRQPWSNGAVGMYGGSYNGFAQWAALKRPHPALKTIVPYVAAIPGLGLPMENNVGLTANYGWAFYVGNTPYLDEATYNDRARWNSLGPRWFESGRPYREIDQVDGTPNPWLQRWLQHPAYDAYWQAMVPQRREYARIDIPVLSITGYYDDGQISALEYLKQHEAHHKKPRHVLVIGPYDHVGAQQARKAPVLRGYAIDPVAQLDTPGLTFQWLDHVLRGGPRPALLKGRINYQVMGSNRWAHAPSLQALHHKPTKFYLQPATRAGAPHSLGPRPPPRGASLLQVVDFADRSRTGNSYYPWPILGRSIDTSSGFTFVSAPLKAARTLAGSFSGELKIRLNKRDVDLGVVLYELTPEGEYLHLSYFLGRASFAGSMARRQLLKPGQVQTVRFSRTRMVARELRAGSRLVVQVNVNKNGGAQLNMGTGKDVSDESLADAGAPLQLEWLAGSHVKLPLQ